MATSSRTAAQKRKPATTTTPKSGAGAVTTTNKTTPVANKPKPKPKKKDKKDRSPESFGKTAEQSKRDAEEAANKYYGAGSLQRMGPAGMVSKINLPGMITPISTVMAGGAESIAQSEKAYEQSRQKDMYMEEALKRSMSLTDGFSAPENQALKVQAERSIKDSAQSSMRQLKQFNAESGVSGGAANQAAMRLNRATQRALAGSSTDLAVAGLQEKGRRVDAFGNMAQGAYSTYQAAQDAAMGRLLGARKDVAGYQLEADQANQNAEGMNINNRINVDTANSGIERGNLNAASDVEKFNIGQSDAEKSGYLGVLFGSQQVDEAQRNQAFQDWLSKQMLNTARHQAGIR